MPISNGQQQEINICGSNTFGRYKKISSESTYNMFLSDGWLINFPGFKRAINISDGNGRGIFNSVRGGFIILVVDAIVYQLNASLVPVQVGTLATGRGDVFIDENLASQICLVDGKFAYIFNYSTAPPSFTQQTLLFNALPIFPSWVCYHNSFFLFGSSPSSPNSAYWYAFEYASATTIQFNNQFSIQSKPDFALVVQRIPGKGNNVLVLGSTIAEIWTQVGGLQNYSKIQSFSADYGVVSISTVASSENYICWLSQNENLDLAIRWTDGNDVQRISTDGIDYVLSEIEYPTQSSAFFYRQGGHLFYQLTFSNPADNLTLIYDFTEQKFYYLTDQNLNYHPARQIVFYIDQTYFISLNDGNLYTIDTNLLTYDYDTLPTSVGEEIPRIRICKAIRNKEAGIFRVGDFTFWIEQGVVPQNAPTPARVDMSFSKDGGQSFSSVVSRPLNSVGNYKNQLRYQNMGFGNEFMIQLRFYGFQRMVVNNGIASIY